MNTEEMINKLVPLEEALKITDEDINLLKEMKKNCLKSNVYEDDKRLLKANAISKFLILYEKNQELRKKLDVLKHNEKQASDSCRQHRLASKNHIRRLKRREEQIMRLKTQQKKFISYLENESKKVCRDMGFRQNIYKEILSKYKEIIGVSNEKDNN